MNTVKKITLISLITAFMCCTIFCVPTSALLLNDEVTSIEYLDNGDRIETVISYKAPDKSSVTVNSSTKTAFSTAQLLIALYSASESEQTFLIEFLRSSLSNGEQIKPVFPSSTISGSPP